jgi:K+-sensing histidine kinase KdpD
MKWVTKHKLAIVTIVYWFLLLYVVAALVFWFVELNSQNNAMAQMRLVELNKDDPNYIAKVEVIEAAQKRKTSQYIGEGTTFLALTIVVAVFVFRATRRQFVLSHQQQNFMMAVTHELKTPIAVTRLNLETLQKRKLDEEMQQKLIANTLQEANRLNILCNNILLAAQLDAGVYSANKQEVHFSDIVNVCVKDFATRYPQRHIIGNVQKNINVQGEELLLQMLVNNLVENALKYSPKEGVIEIVLSEEDKKVELKIKDEGAGIANDEKKKIFNKFYRTGNENVRTAKGTGLGLYLCRKIVKSHGGNIAVTDNQPSGSIFTVTFNA